MPEMSSLHNERMAATIFGVVIFIVDDNNRVLTLKEKETKESTGKKHGEFACICETKEKDENLPKNSLRALTEELGMSPQHLIDVVDPDSLSVWETGFVTGAWATVIKLKCKDSNKLLELVGVDSKPDGVEVVGFKDRNEFEHLNLRLGVRNIMNKFGDEIFGQ